MNENPLLLIINLFHILNLHIYILNLKCCIFVIIFSFYFIETFILILNFIVHSNFLILPI